MLTALTDEADKELGQANAMAVDWLAPNSANAQEVRQAAQKVLEEVAKATQFAHLREEATRQLEEQFQPPKHRYEWVGWLSRHSSGGWTCLPEEHSEAAFQVMCVLIPRTDGAGASFQPIEINQSGGVVPVTAALFGRPVFLQTPWPGR